MKGIVFTEFMEMVEDRFSANMADDIIGDAAPPSGAAYTAVGSYDHSELVALVTALSGRTGVPVPELVQAFGHHMFGRFFTLYPHFFAGIGDAVTFLSSIEDVIHVEVLKLYPDAQLPRFDCRRLPDGGLDMLYRSPRRMEDFAHGLIESAVAHWGGHHAIQRSETADGTRFLIRPL